jgi:hypothetical protein
MTPLWKVVLVILYFWFPVSWVLHRNFHTGIVLCSWALQIQHMTQTLLFTCADCITMKGEVRSCWLSPCRKEFRHTLSQCDVGTTAMNSVQIHFDHASYLQWTNQQCDKVYGSYTCFTVRPALLILQISQKNHKGLQTAWSAISRGHTDTTYAHTCMCTNTCKYRHRKGKMIKFSEVSLHVGQYGIQLYLMETLFLYQT